MGKDKRLPLPFKLEISSPKFHVKVIRLSGRECKTFKLLSAPFMKRSLRVFFLNLFSNFFFYLFHVLKSFDCFFFSPFVFQLMSLSKFLTFHQSNINKSRQLIKQQAWRSTKSMHEEIFFLPFMPAKCQVEQFYGVIKKERSDLIFTALLTYRPASFSSAQIRDKNKEAIEE